MQERNLESYRYTECGLDGVYVKGLETLVDDHGEEVLHIRNVNGLHKLIARAIVHRDAAMSSRDLRFLRTEMGFTQSQLASACHKMGNYLNPRPIRRFRVAKILRMW